MPQPETASVNLHGSYRDVLRDACGNVSLDSGVRRNAIVTNCRRLLAGFMRGAPAATGIQGLRVGSGLPAWDGQPLPQPTGQETSLVNPLLTVPAAQLQLDFLVSNADTVSPTPTNRLRIIATLGPGVPAGGGTLREFGLFGQLNATDALINYVIHPAIVKDATSTLERTIWLVF